MKEIKTHREDKQMRQRDGADMSKSDRERESKRSIYPQLIKSIEKWSREWHLRCDDDAVKHEPAQFLPFFRQ